MSFTVGLLLIAMTSVAMINTTPVLRRNTVPWAQPCRPVSSRVSGVSLIAGSHSQSDILESLARSTSEAFDSASVLKEQIFRQRLDAGLDHAESLSVHNIPPLPLPEAVLTWSHSGQTEDVLTTNYRHLSYLLVFLEVIREDSLTHRQRDGVQERLNNLETKLFEVLCHIEGLMFSLDITIDDHVTRDEVPMQVREMRNRAFINARDFVIAKDAVHLLRAVRDTHIQMHEGY